MPYPNEHSCRVRDPGDFQKGSFKSKTLPKSEGSKGGVRIIIGRLKGETTTTVQAYRFPKDKYTVAEAKKWLKDNDVKCKEFEPASKEDSRDILTKLQDLWAQFIQSIQREFGPNEWDEPESSVRAIGFSRLYEQFYTLLRDGGAEWPRVMDIYLDDGDMYGLVASDGKLFRYPLGISDNDELEITGDAVPIVEIHQPTEGEPRSHIGITRQADGRIRFTAVACTAILNRIGCIDSTTLFDNMIRHAEESGDYPYATLWHLGEEFRMGQVDLLARDGVVYLASGLMDEGNALAEGVASDVEADPDFWGTSIKFLPLDEPRMVQVTDELAIPVYEDGIHLELSFLPEQRAASLFTSTGVTRQEVEHMRKEIEALLRKVLPTEEADEWVSRVDEVNRTAEEPGVISREGEPQETAPAGEPQGDLEPTGDEGDEVSVILDDEAVDAIIRHMAESVDLTSLFAPLQGIDARITELTKAIESARAASTEALVKVQERLDKLEREEEEKQREWLADLPPSRTTRVVTFRPRQARDPSNGGSQERVNLAGVAEATLANMPQYGRKGR